MKVYDPKSLISALKEANKLQKELIEKIISENVELKERLISTQRVPDVTTLSAKADSFLHEAKAVPPPKDV